MKIQIVITIDCTEKGYEDNLKELQLEIQSGQMQRELTSKDRGIKKVVSTFKILKR